MWAGHADHGGAGGGEVVWEGRGGWWHSLCLGRQEQDVEALGSGQRAR
jgi:hypothetical protein